MSGVKIWALTNCDMSKISAQAYWVIFCRIYPNSATAAARPERCFGGLVALCRASSSLFFGGLHQFVELLCVRAVAWHTIGAQRLLHSVEVWSRILSIG
jgi:hypothetical protein